MELKQTMSNSILHPPTTHEYYMLLHLAPVFFLNHHVMSIASRFFFQSSIHKNLFDLRLPTILYLFIHWTRFVLCLSSLFLVAGDANIIAENAANQRAYFARIAVWRGVGAGKHKKRGSTTSQGGDAGQEERIASRS